MDLEDMRRLYPKVERLVEPKEDNVRFYWMSESAIDFVMTIGSKKPEPPDIAIII
jgi:CRISPR-associated protein Cas2